MKNNLKDITIINKYLIEDEYLNGNYLFIQVNLIYKV